MGRVILTAIIICGAPGLASSQPVTADYEIRIFDNDDDGGVEFRGTLSVEEVGRWSFRGTLDGREASGQWRRYRDQVLVDFRTVEDDEYADIDFRFVGLLRDVEGTSAIRGYVEWTRSGGDSEHSFEALAEPRLVEERSLESVEPRVEERIGSAEAAAERWDVEESYTCEEAGEAVTAFAEFVHLQLAFATYEAHVPTLLSDLLDRESDLYEGLAGLLAWAEEQARTCR